jgi:hypothetical protein
LRSDTGFLLGFPQRRLPKRFLLRSVLWADPIGRDVASVRIVSVGSAGPRQTSVRSLQL